MVAAVAHGLATAQQLSPVACEAERHAAPSAWVWSALGLIYVVWGSTYVAQRIMDRTIPPLLGAGIRFGTAGCLMLAYVLATRRRSLGVSPRECGSCALIGVLLFAGGNGVICYAQLRVPAGSAALVIASVPLWLLVIRLLAHEHPPRATILGLGVGFAGVALLVLREGSRHGVGIGSMLLLLGAALSWALGSWLSGRLPVPDDLALASGLEMTAGGISLFTIAPLVAEHWGTVADRGTLSSFLAIAFLVVAGSILSFSAYAWLLRNAPISQVSTYAYVNPVVAVVLGAVLLDEAVSSTTVLGGLIVLLAVALVIRAEARELQLQQAP